MIFFSLFFSFGKNSFIKKRIVSLFFFPSPRRNHGEHRTEGSARGTSSFFSLSPREKKLQKTKAEREFNLLLFQKKKNKAVVDG